ncbi:hypothetical protein [Geminocystis sp. NIES-3709]|uniref:hypothetical protein n=1 Tax=Geminocystis sp. NIES-3709 TaxID=1617448 RepID=UPI0005FCB2B3|nr:hypothetical protein [Geminocystis sp. NIES-3709]BAQ64509.1 conserved domain protein [Geminocystis sp. NIES-3709]
MLLKDNQELQLIKNSIIEGMLDYIVNDDNPAYTKADVEEFDRILEEHLLALSKTENKNSAMKCVKMTVIKLNQLNQKAGEELIETDQREGICEYIIKAGVLLGFNNENEDITEEWREW